MARFLRFARGPSRSASRVLFLGDLFEVWVTPDQRHDAGLLPVFEALAALVGEGVRVGFVEGNRDFAATPELRRLGVEPEPDVTLVEAFGQRVAATHGDRLCTRDVSYQALRRVARTGLVRHLLRSAPPRLARSVGAGARAGSRRETARKAYGDMGLDPRAVRALLAAHDADALVCGHVHWGRRYRVEAAGSDRDVIVLGAWDGGGATYAELGPEGLAFHAFH